MAQFARPAADVATGGWGTAPLWSKIDEVSPSDTDFITSNNNTSPDTATVAISALNVPADDSGHILRVRGQKSAADGHLINIVVRLLSTTATIAVSTFADVTTGYVTRTMTLTSAEAGLISDYSTLRVDLERTGDVGGAGGNRRSAEISWVEFETPDTAFTPTSVSAQLDSITSVSAFANVRRTYGSQTDSASSAASLIRVTRALTQQIDVLSSTESAATIFRHNKAAVSSQAVVDPFVNTRRTYTTGAAALTSTESFANTRRTFSAGQTAQSAVAGGLTTLNATVELDTQLDSTASIGILGRFMRFLKSKVIDATSTITAFFMNRRRINTSLSSASASGAEMRVVRNMASQFGSESIITATLPSNATQKLYTPVHTVKPLMTSKPLRAVKPILANLRLG